MSDLSTARKIFLVCFLAFCAVALVWTFASWIPRSWDAKYVLPGRVSDLERRVEDLESSMGIEE